jgi:hypothetical protein
MRYWIVYDEANYPMVYRAETAQEAHEKGTVDGWIVTRVSRGSRQVSEADLYADIMGHCPGSMNDREASAVARTMQEMGAVADGGGFGIVHWDIDRLADAVMTVYAEVQ